MKTGLVGPLAKRARAEEKNHRGTEGTEKGCDLCLRARCAAVVQPSSQKRGSVRASELNPVGPNRTRIARLET